ncbi:hypothetical protein D3C86_1207900 [compost metagenome]
MDSRFIKNDAVQFKFIREIPYFFGVSIFQRTIAVTFVESHLDRIRQPLKETFILFITESVDDQINRHIFLRHKSETLQILNPSYISIDFQSCETRDFQGF